MSRRIVGGASPLLFTLALLLLGSPFAVAGDLPSASGETPYSEVSGEEPVKPEAGQSGKHVSPAVEVRKAKESKSGQAVSRLSRSRRPRLRRIVINPPSRRLPRPAEATVGEPLAPGMIEILQQEIRNAVRNRGIDDNFARFQRYSGYKLDSSAAAYTGSELAGNCRLSWYDHMLRHPLGAVAEAEQFTRDVHTAILKDRGGLARLLPIIADKLDLPKRRGPQVSEGHTRRRRRWTSSSRP